MATIDQCNCIPTIHQPGCHKFRSQYSIGLATTPRPDAKASEGIDLAGVCTCGSDIHNPDCHIFDCACGKSVHPGVDCHGNKPPASESSEPAPCERCQHWPCNCEEGYKKPTASDAPSEGWEVVGYSCVICHGAKKPICGHTTKIEDGDHPLIRQSDADERIATAESHAMHDNHALALCDRKLAEAEARGDTYLEKLGKEQRANRTLVEGVRIVIDYYETTADKKYHSLGMDDAIASLRTLIDREATKESK